jgi:hypothetical protein
MTLAHIAGVPAEELLLLAPTASAWWLAVRFSPGFRAGSRRIRRRARGG